jgi:hypothetical protein
LSFRVPATYILTTLALGAAAACASQPTPPPVDDMATRVASLASGMLTQTAGAASPTPTVTLTPLPTATLEATATRPAQVKRPMTLAFAGCWFGPGPEYTLESNIDKGKGVELLGIGSVPGWYVVRNPYFHRPCWIAAADLKIYDGTDLSKYPVMTPGVPLPGS